MKKQNPTTKLASVEASLKRWQTRLTRAANKVNELDRKRRKLQAQMGPVGLTDLIGPAVSTKPLPTIDVDEVRRQVDAAIDTTIPPEFKRQEVDVSALTAQRKSKEAAARKQMPLTGRAAEEYIKPKRKKAS